jgi:transposase-like protein
MIRRLITYACRACGSTNIVKNGTNKCGNAQYHCKDCGVYRVLQPETRYAPEEKATILRACTERISLRGLQRVFGVHRQTVSRWLVEQTVQMPLLVETLLPVQADDVLEAGALIKPSCRLSSTVAWAKRAARLPTKSVGTTPCVSGWRVLSAKPCPSLNPTPPFTGGH